MIGFIYCINVGKKKYVGQTTDLVMRESGHNSALRCGGNTKLYKYAREKGKTKLKLIVLETINDCDRRTLLNRESYWINFLNAELNVNVGDDEGDDPLKGLEAKMDRLRKELKKIQKEQKKYEKTSGGV